MRTFTFYTDPGHGWLMVHMNDLHDIEMSPGQFSGYSYRDHDWLYLEEDCDANIFLANYERLRGNFRIRHEYDDRDSFIRSLPHNQPADLDDSIIF